MTKIRAVLWTSSALLLFAQPATDVLVGTDVRKLSSFKFAMKSVPLKPGKYTTETGGARINLEIRKNKTGVLEAVRSFAEPGEKPRVMTYRGFVPGKDGVYRTAVAQIRIATDPPGSILLLESKSGIEEIPPTLWILFQEERNQP
jgi:hypothetical protein